MDALDHRILIGPNLTTMAVNLIRLADISALEMNATLVIPTEVRILDGSAYITKTTVEKTDILAAGMTTNDHDRVDLDDMKI